MANPFIKIKAGIDYSTGHHIQWNLDPNFKATLPYRFELEMAEDQTFNKIIFTKDAGDNFHAVDDSRLKQNFGSTYQYRIKLTDGDERTYYSIVFNFGMDNPSRHKYLMASEMVRKEWVRMQYTGKFGWLIKRKVYGATATTEVHPISGVPITDNKTHFGASIDGGYYPPIRIKYSQENQSQSTKLDEQGLGVKYEEAMQLRLVSFPFVESHDILVSTDDKRWLVTAVKEFIFPGTDTTLIQVVDCRIIANTDSIYSIKLPNE